MNNNNIGIIYNEIRKMNIRLSNIEHKYEHIDVESVITTNNILMNNKINSLKIKLNELDNKLIQITYKMNTKSDKSVTINKEQ